MHVSLRVRPGSFMVMMMDDDDDGHDEVDSLHF
jgi:hypothetical protein